MPKFNDMQSIKIPGAGNFQFSAIRPEKLGASEYTLVTIVVDVTYSVSDFKDDLLEAVKAIIRACRQNPRVDNLMVRLLTFNEKRKEIHGFVPLNQIDPDHYQPFKCTGATALYDAVYDAVAATNQYAKNLFAQDFDVNAAIYIVTDGEDNRSTTTPADIAAQVHSAAKQEFLESLITVLIGIGTASASASAYLQLFKDEAKLSRFVDVADASPDNLAKLGAFVSRSISLHSQSLGKSGASAAQSLTF